MDKMYEKQQIYVNIFGQWTKEILDENELLDTWAGLIL
jgi:hypothetical protein